MKGLIAAGVLAAPLILTSAAAQAFLGSEEYDITAFCDTHSPRQTIVYIDDTILIEGQKQWAERLYAKLMANLMPSEPVAVVRLSPDTGRADEVWNACYPDYTEAQKATLECGLFSKCWKDVLESQQAVFGQQLGAALGKVWTEAARPPGQVAVDPAKVPGKQLFRALASDEARFDRTRGEIRAIVYSDMIENSDLGMALSSTADEAGTAAGRLGLNLQNAVVYAYGVGATLPRRGTATEGTKAFWESFFRSAAAQIAGFGTDLVVTTSTPVAEFNYEIEVATPDQPRVGRMHLFADRDGNLQDSYVLLGTRGRSLLTEGKLQCKGDDVCTLDAKAPGAVLTVEGDEEIKLSGPLDALAGTIGVVGGKLPDGTPAMFEMTSKRVQ